MHREGLQQKALLVICIYLVICVYNRSTSQASLSRLCCLWLTARYVPPLAGYLSSLCSQQNHLQRTIPPASSRHLFLVH